MARLAALLSPARREQVMGWPGANQAQQSLCRARVEADFCKRRRVGDCMRSNLPGPRGVRIAAAAGGNWPVRAIVARTGLALGPRKARASGSSWQQSGHAITLLRSALGWSISDQNSQLLPEVGGALATATIARRPKNRLNSGDSAAVTPSGTPRARLLPAVTIVREGKQTCNRVDLHQRLNRLLKHAVTSANTGQRKSSASALKIRDT
jgi:hypothetical protein